MEIRGQRLDLLAEPGVIVELKTADRLTPIHEWKLVGYLESSGFRPARAPDQLPH